MGSLSTLFREVHGERVFRIWMRNDQVPVVRIVPLEPLGCVSATAPASLGDTVTIVSLRCSNVRGVMQFEAASPADQQAIDDWTGRHHDTPPEAFCWMPDFGRSPLACPR